MEDAIIVLGGGISPRGVIDKFTRLRVKKAVALYKKKISKNIIMSGRWSFFLKNTPARSEAEAMKEYAVKLGGVPEGAIFVENQSADTIGNAFFVKKMYLVPKKWKRLCIITSAFHAKRAEIIFRKICGRGFEIRLALAPDNLPREKLEQRKKKEMKNLEIFRKWFADIKDGDDTMIARLLETKHPGYAKHPEITVEQLKRALRSAS